MQVNKELHTCTSWYAYAAMFGSSTENTLRIHLLRGGGGRCGWVGLGGWVGGLGGWVGGSGWAPPPLPGGAEF